jgi:hypothetical protein
MSKALASYGTGACEAYREFTLPPMRRYAERHGYAACFDSLPTLDPPSWGKVPLIRQLLDDHEAVLWLDADVLIFDPSDDLAADVPAWAVQAMVRHTVNVRHAHGVVPVDVHGQAMVPNTGIWYVTRYAAPLLDAMLSLYPQHRDSVWWEQSAMVELLPNGWAGVTHWLDPSWNRHVFDSQPCDRQRFIHATAVTDRVGLLRSLAEFVH